MKYMTGKRNFWIQESRPVRALWIEMPVCNLNKVVKDVEAREGLVD